MEEYKKHISHPSFSKIVEYDFNFNEYMEKRLKDIDDINERKLSNKLVREPFEKVIEVIEAKYKSLEQYVYNEFKLLDEKYGINMTVVKKDDYAYTNGTLFPMCYEDLENISVTLDKAINDKQYLKTVFFKGTEKEMKDFNKKKIEGKIYTSKGEYSCVFKIVRASRYFDKVISLYELFKYNYILWTTINLAFIDRLYDVVIESVDIENIEELDTEKVTVKNIEIDFKSLNLSEKVEIIEELIPLWNVEEVQVTSSEFMKPFIDEKYYEHSIDLKEHGLENGYLLGINDDILSLNFENDKISVKAKVETFESWKAYKIVNREPVISLNYNYPMLNNKRKENFTRRYLTNNSVNLKTEFDYIRKINELSVEKYIEYVGYELLSREYWNKFDVIENNMNKFVEKSIFPYEDRKVLLFKFKILDKNCFLNDSIIRFVISQIQLEEHDYLCVGVEEDYKLPKLEKEEIY